MMAVTLLPSLYEYYTTNGIQTGLSANQQYFQLNNKNVTIYSGAMHYFRVPKQYWRDRLRKLRYAGLNTVETYVPWNLHEPEPGVYDFGNGGTDMEQFLDLETFLKTAQEEDLFAIVRPGPYICAEWEFGGLPSWLLRENDIKVRTSDKNFMKHVIRFFNVLLPILAAFQFTNGGPIIAFQVENEYGSMKRRDFTPDKIYLKQLYDLMKNNNIVELLFTSDGPSLSGTFGTIPELFLQTANFNHNPIMELNTLNQLQTNKPTMVAEYWAGWFDHWTEAHHVGNLTHFRTVYEIILKYPASVNLYMFHGGTSYGFLNGANIDKNVYKPDVNSYDYDAPLSENGDYTVKFYIVKQLIEQYSTIKIKQIQQKPKEIQRIAYKNIELTEYLNYNKIVEQIPDIVNSMNLLSMEFLPINNDSGQSYGYIIYRKKNLNLNMNSILTIQGYINDFLLIFINGQLISKQFNNVDDLNSYWRNANVNIKLSETPLNNVTLDLFVENMGRNNYGQLKDFQQFKGLRDGVLINNKPVYDWQIFPLEFKRKWTQSLKNWQTYDKSNTGCGLYKGILNVDMPIDTYIDLTNWKKGIVIVNGFVLGRYMHIGPQQTLYLPAPLLNYGTNEIILFEQYQSFDKIQFSKEPIYYTKL